MPAEMSPMCHSLGVDGPFHRSTNLLRSIPTKLFLSLSVSSCFLLYFLLSSFVLTLFYTLYCCSCTNIFISFTPTNIVPSVARGQVISVRFRTVEDQFLSRGSQSGAPARQRGTVLCCQFSFGYIWTTDTLVATVRRLKGPDPEYTSNLLSVSD